LYIFDRHCACIYYQDWHRVKRPKPAAEGNILPAVARAVSQQSTQTVDQTVTSPRHTLNSTSGVVVAVTEAVGNLMTPREALVPPQMPMSSLPFDEEAKLVYGVMLSLRNMIKKLSGRDEHFVNYHTSAYKFHLYETLSGYKFVMLSDPAAESLRFVLRQIYTGPFIEYVVRNPLVRMDSRTHGIDTEHFRNGTDRLVRSLSSFTS